VRGCEGFRNRERSANISEKVCSDWRDQKTFDIKSGTSIFQNSESQQCKKHLGGYN
jgi:hypothetical protein